MGSAQQKYRNTSDTPFATISDGPQEAIVIDADGIPKDQLYKVIAARARAALRAMNDGGRRSIEEMKRRKMIPADMVMPITQIVVLREKGKLLFGDRGPRTQGGSCLTLDFSVTPGETFPTAYQQALTDAFTASTPLLDSVYGSPYVCGAIKVVNYDTQMADRDAVIGGIFIQSDPLHGGLPTILFAVYNSQAAAQVNFVNLLVHAYHGPVTFDFDAWEQGFSRAATMKVVRQIYPGDQQVAAVLDATYEIRQFYDWLNQPPLSNNTFIAPSLRNEPIPSGVTGGMFLPRYRMAGSAWAKVLQEYPSFFSQFNAIYYADPNPKQNLAGNVPALVAIGASIAPTVEGRPFAQWFQNQWVLNSSVTLGRKLYTTPIPILSGLFPGETGAFAVIYDLYETIKTGDEKLLAGVIFPIYWTFDFARMNLGAQYERSDVQGGTGTVAPSFTDNAQMVTIDSPTFDIISRVQLPIGTVATQQFSHNFYGTVYGLTDPDPVTGKVGSIEAQTLAGTVTTDIIRGAFGTDLTLDAETRVNLTIKDKQGIIVATRQVNAGPDSLAVQIEAFPQSNLQRQFPAGIQMFTLPITPFNKDAAALFGVPSNQFLLSRWRQDLFTYVLYPYTPPIQPGYAFFLKPMTPIQPVTFDGIRPPSDQPFAVPLQVGWNQIGNPLLTSGFTDLADVWVQKGPEDPAIGWAEAVANGWVSDTVFRFDQNISNPDSGTNVATTQIEAFKGYWVRVLAAEGVTVLFRGGSGLGPRSSFSPPAANGWDVKLEMRSEDGNRTYASIGTDSRASEGYDRTLESPLPPAFGATLQLAIPHTDWGANSGDFYSDLRPDSGKATWKFKASGLSPGKNYTISWPALATMKREVRLTLTDVATGRKVNMRSLTSLSFTPEGTTRELKVEAEPKTASSLRLTALNTNSTRGSTTVSFALNQQASVGIEVLSASGKLIARLSSNAALAEGLHTINWNGRDDAGISMPPGQYVISVNAVADDGSVARAVRPVVVRR